MLDVCGCVALVSALAADVAVFVVGAVLVVLQPSTAALQAGIWCMCGSVVVVHAGLLAALLLQLSDKLQARAAAAAPSTA